MKFKCILQKLEENSALLRNNSTVPAGMNTTGSFSDVRLYRIQR